MFHRSISVTGFCLSLASLPLSGWAIDPFNVDAMAKQNAYVSTPTQASILCQQSSSVSGQLSLPEAMVRLLCTHPKLAQSVAESEVAAAGVGVALSNYLPRLSANVDYNWSEQRFEELGSTSKVDRRGNSLKLNWQLFDFGRTQAKVAQSSALVDLANATQDVVMQQLVTTGLNAYFDAVVAQAQLQARKAAVALSQRSLAVVQGRHVGGVTTQDELLQAKSRLAQAQLLLQKAEDAWHLKKGLLANLLSLSLNDPINLPLPEQLTFANRSFMSLSLDQYLQQATELHPRVLSAKAQQAASQSKVDLAQAEHLPVLSLNGQYVNAPPPTGSIFVPDYYSTIGVQLSLPLSQGFETSYRVKEATAEAQAKQWAIEQELLQARADVWQAFHEWQTNDKQRMALTQIVHLAVQLEQVTQARYRAGVGSVFDWLESQKLLAEAQSDYAQKMSETIAAQLRLAAATGRVELTVSP